MKTITIGDVHGSTFWKEAKDNVDKYDKVIFLGDYVDHWTISNEFMEHNLKQIIMFKEMYPDKVELLLGNHDLQYMFDSYLHTCSGLRAEKKIDWHQLFNDNANLFKAAHYEETLDGQYLWTHAGISNAWYITRFIEFSGLYDNLGEALNEAFVMYDKRLFDVGHSRYGMQPYGGPFWADFRETFKDMLSNVHQIVGHSKVNSIQTINKNVNTSITYVDVFEGDNPELYKLEI